MLLTFTRRFIGLWILVLIQALILDDITLFGYATPFLYSYLLLKFDADLSRYSLLVWGFFLGLAVDLFLNTPGINAGATTLLAFMRPVILRLYTPRDAAEDLIPGVKTMGTGLFLRYVITAVSIHITALNLLLSFSLAYPLDMFIRIVSSTLFTSLIIWAVDRARS